MGVVCDLIGKKFGRLTVLERMPNDKHHNAKWKCKCDCGSKKEPVVTSSDLNSGHVQSCGCLQKERSSETMSKTNKKYNTYDLSGEYGIGYTSKGDEFYFDLEDYDKIKEYCWYKHATGYIKGRMKTGKHVQFHRFILDIEDESIEVDHIAHLLYDNRKSQLRVVSRSQNMMNKVTYKNNTSGVKGVYWKEKNQCWVAEIQGDNVRKHLGCFSNFEDAVKIRKEAEQKYHGEYSYDKSVENN